MSIYDGVPNAGYMAGGVERYIEQGIPPGHFLTALFANDLMEAFACADGNNRAAMWEWCVWLYNARIPRDCRGSRENVQAWIEIGGWDGFVRQQEKEAAQQEKPL